MKKLFNIFRKTEKVEKVFVERTHKMQSAELFSTGFTSTYVRF